MEKISQARVWLERCLVMANPTPDPTGETEQERFLQDHSQRTQAPTRIGLLAEHNGSGAVWIQGSAVFLLISIWSLVLYNTKGNVPFALYHPLLVSLGLFFLLQGVMVLQPTSTLPSKKVGLELHQLFILGLGLPLITSGVWVMWHAHARPGAKHFISLHGILGVLLLVLLWVQAIFGISTVWGNGQAYGSQHKAKSMWKYHR